MWAESRCGRVFCSRAYRIGAWYRRIGANQPVCGPAGNTAVCAFCSNNVDKPMPWCRPSAALARRRRPGGFALRAAQTFVGFAQRFAAVGVDASILDVVVRAANHLAWRAALAVRRLVVLMR